VSWDYKGDQGFHEAYQDNSMAALVSFFPYLESVRRILVHGILPRVATAREGLALAMCHRISQNRGVPNALLENRISFLFWAEPSQICDRVLQHVSSVMRQ
jgi:hypothetical protein